MCTVNNKCKVIQQRVFIFKVGQCPGVTTFVGGDTVLEINMLNVNQLFTHNLFKYPSTCA